METCSFTGHRFINKALMKRLENELTKAVRYVYSEGCRTFYCGGALGFDTIAAKILIKERLFFPDIRIVIAAPCVDQAAKWSGSDRDTYEYILAAANEVIYVSEEYTSDCMKRRNAYLVSVCDVLIAYSGKPNSGSAQTVRMAISENKTVYNLYSRINQVPSDF